MSFKDFSSKTMGASAPANKPVIVPPTFHPAPAPKHAVGPVAPLATPIATPPTNKP